MQCLFSYTWINKYATFEIFYDYALTLVGCQVAIRWSEAKIPFYISIHDYLGMGFMSCSTWTLLDNRLILFPIHKTFLILRTYVLRCSGNSHSRDQRSTSRSKEAYLNTNKSGARNDSSGRNNTVTRNNSSICETNFNWKLIPFLRPQW